MYETQEVLLDTPLIRVTSAVDKSGSNFKVICAVRKSYPTFKVISPVHEYSRNFAVFVIEDCTDGEKVIIYRRDLVKLAALLNNEIAKRAKLPATTADNCRDCIENNSGVTL